jgi:hypothetical protein
MHKSAAHLPVRRIAGAVKCVLGDSHFEPKASFRLADVNTKNVQFNPQ